MPFGHWITSNLAIGLDTTTDFTLYCSHHWKSTFTKIWLYCRECSTVCCWNCGPPRSRSLHRLWQMLVCFLPANLKVSCHTLVTLLVFCLVCFLHSWGTTALGNPLMVISRIRCWKDRLFSLGLMSKFWMKFLKYPGELLIRIVKFLCLPAGGGIIDYPGRLSTLGLSNPAQCIDCSGRPVNLAAVMHQGYSIADSRTF